MTSQTQKSKKTKKSSLKTKLISNQERKRMKRPAMTRRRTRMIKKQQLKG
jgi:hypothetical protein